MKFVVYKIMVFVSVFIIYIMLFNIDGLYWCVMVIIVVMVMIGILNFLENVL